MVIVPGGFVAFLQKCWYKWQPRKCLGLDVANFFIFNLKMVEKSLNIKKIACFFFFFFHFYKILLQVAT
jgi:hypothetical protein